MAPRFAIRALAALAVTTACLFWASSAGACSCVPLSVKSFKSQDEAIVAKLVRVDSVPGEDFTADFVFRVTRSLKRPTEVQQGDQISIRASTSSAACGFTIPVGARIGLLLYLQDGELSSNSCLSTSPRALRRLAREARGKRTATSAAAGCGASA